MWSNPLGKRSLHVLRTELSVHICSDYRLVQRETVRRAGDQTVCDAVDAGF